MKLSKRMLARWRAMIVQRNRRQRRRVSEARALEQRGRSESPQGSGGEKSQTPQEGHR